MIDRDLTNVLSLFLLKFIEMLNKFCKNMAHYLSTLNTVNRWLEHFINIRTCLFEVLRDLANVNELANNVFSRSSLFYELNNLALQNICNYINILSPFYNQHVVKDKEALYNVTYLKQTT